MGYGTHRFLVAPDQNLLCGICSGVVEGAVLTKCGHTFCEACLDTWLARPNTGNCPVCRARVVKYQVSPVWSLRAMVCNLNIRCTNSDRGCKTVVKLESLSSHLKSCGYAPVDCIGCGLTVYGFQLAAHQIECPKIVASAAGPTFADIGNGKAPINFSTHDCTDIFDKIASLEVQLQHMKKDLEAAKTKNRKLERELITVKTDLKAKQEECELLRVQNHNLFPRYDYGHTPESIAQLSLFIACYLLDKPDYVDKDNIFHCIKTAYENLARCGDEYEHDVHMLIATAYASDWFDENQRINFHCWLQSIARYRKYADLHYIGASKRCSITWTGNMNSNT